MAVTNELTTMYHTLSFSPYLKFLQIGVVGVLCAYKLKYKKVHLNLNIHSEPLPPPPLSRKKDSPALSLSGVQFNRHLKFKAWVKDKVKDAFRKALDREMVKVWV